jgi:ATP-dependent RNA helicase DDX52/ROK1
MGFLEQTDEILDACGREEGSVKPIVTEIKGQKRKRNDKLDKKSSKKRKLSKQISDDENDSDDQLSNDPNLNLTGPIKTSHSKRPFRTYLFSATVPSQSEYLSQTFLHPSHVRIIVGSKHSPPPCIVQHLIFTNTEEAKLPTLRALVLSPESLIPSASAGGKNEKIKMSYDSPAIVFVQSVDRAKELYVWIKNGGLGSLTGSGKIDELGRRVGLVHGEMEGQEREEMVNKFERGEIWTMVATDLVGRGLDWKGAKMVM